MGSKKTGKKNKNPQQTVLEYAVDHVYKRLESLFFEEFPFLNGKFEFGKLFSKETLKEKATAIPIIPDSTKQNDSIKNYQREFGQVSLDKYLKSVSENVISSGMLGHYSKIFFHFTDKIRRLKHAEQALKKDRSDRPSVSCDTDEVEALHNFTFGCLLNRHENLLYEKDRMMFMAGLSVLKVAYAGLANKTKDGKELSNNKKKENDKIKRKLLTNFFSVFSNPDYLDHFYGIIPSEYIDSIKSDNTEKLKELFIESFLGVFPENLEFDLTYNCLLFFHDLELNELLMDSKYISDSLDIFKKSEQKIGLLHDYEYSKLASDTVFSQDGLFGSISYLSGLHFVDSILAGVKNEEKIKQDFFKKSFESNRLTSSNGFAENFFMKTKHDLENTVLPELKGIGKESATYLKSKSYDWLCKAPENSEEFKRRLNIINMSNNGDIYRLENISSYKEYYLHVVHKSKLEFANLQLVKIREELRDKIINIKFEPAEKLIKDDHIKFETPMQRAEATSAPAEISIPVFTNIQHQLASSIPEYYEETKKARKPKRKHQYRQDPDDTIIADKKAKQEQDPKRVSIGQLRFDKDSCEEYLTKVSDTEARQLMTEKTNLPPVLSKSKYQLEYLGKTEYYHEGEKVKLTVFSMRDPSASRMFFVNVDNETLVASGFTNNHSYDMTKVFNDAKKAFTRFQINKSLNESSSSEELNNSNSINNGEVASQERSCQKQSF